MNSTFLFIKNHYLKIVLLNIVVTVAFYAGAIATMGIGAIILLPLFVGMASSLLKMVRSKDLPPNILDKEAYRRPVILRNIFVMLVAKGIPLIIALLYLRYYFLPNPMFYDNMNTMDTSSVIRYIGEWVRFGLSIWFPSMIVASFLSFVPYVLADADDETKVSTIFSRALSMVLPQVFFVFLLRLLTFMRALPLYAVAAMFSLVGSGFADDGGAFGNVTLPAIFYWGLLLVFVFGPLYHMGLTQHYEKRVQKEREMEELENTS